MDALDDLLELRDQPIVGGALPLHQVEDPTTVRRLDVLSNLGVVLASLDDQGFLCRDQLGGLAALRVRLGRPRAIRHQTDRRTSRFGCGWSRRREKSVATSVGSRSPVGATPKVLPPLERDPRICLSGIIGVNDSSDCQEVPPKNTGITRVLSSWSNSMMSAVMRSESSRIRLRTISGTWDFEAPGWLRSTSLQPCQLASRFRRYPFAACRRPETLWQSLYQSLTAMGLSFSSRSTIGRRAQPNLLASHLYVTKILRANCARG